jgi:hypothetical protein
MDKAIAPLSAISRAAKAIFVSFREALRFPLLGDESLISVISGAWLHLRIDFLILNGSWLK